MPLQFTVRQVAVHLGGEVEGDGDRRLEDVRGLEEAGPVHLSFLANPRYARKLAASRAGAVLLAPGADAGGHTAIRLDDPYAGFARALALFHPLDWPEPGVDPRARVAPDAVVDGATVEAFAWVGPRARVGAGSWIEAGAYVGRGVVVGRDCRLMPGSVAYQGSVLGDRVWLNPGAVVGGEGYGFAPTAEGNLKVPQIGGAVIGDDVEIGSNSCVDRGAVTDTVIGRGSKIDNFVQVGHGAVVGEHSLLVSFVGIAGSARLGKRVVFAAKSGAVGHIDVGDDVQVGTQSIVMGSQPDGVRLAGSPAIDLPLWRRAAVTFAKLPEMVQQIRRLERRLAALEAERD